MQNMTGSIPGVVLLGLLTTGAVMESGSDPVHPALSPPPVVQQPAQVQPKLDDRYLKALVAATEEMRGAREDINRGLSGVISAVNDIRIPEPQIVTVEKKPEPEPVVQTKIKRNVRSTSKEIISMRGSGRAVPRTTTVVSNVSGCSSSTGGFSPRTYWRPPPAPPSYAAFTTFGGQ